MAKKKPASKPRNRAAEARAAGRVQIAVEIGQPTVDAITEAVAGLPHILGVGRVSRSQALEWLVGQGLMEFREKSQNGLEKD